MTIIIAEAGVNHNGCINNSFKLIKEAHIAGADYIKFQTFKTEHSEPKTHQTSNFEHIHNSKSQIANIQDFFEAISPYWIPAV